MTPSSWRRQHSDYDDYHRTVLRQLGVEPTDALLAELTRPVDPRVILEAFPEDPGYVAAAIALGYQGLAVLREPGQTADGVPSINSIDALVAFEVHPPEEEVRLTESMPTDPVEASR